MPTGDSAGRGGIGVRSYAWPASLDSRISAQWWRGLPCSLGIGVECSARSPSGCRLVSPSTRLLAGDFHACKGRFRYWSAASDARLSAGHYLVIRLNKENYRRDPETREAKDVNGEMHETRGRARRFGAPMRHAGYHKPCGLAHVASRPRFLSPVSARTAEPAPPFREPRQ
jgi:hypothetical protein